MIHQYSSNLQGNPDIGTTVEYRKALLASLDMSPLDKPHFQLENMLRRLFHESNLDDTGLDDGVTTSFQHRQTHYHMLIFKLQSHTFGIKEIKKAQNVQKQRPSSRLKRQLVYQGRLLAFKIFLGVDLEPNEWIKDSGCSRHMTGTMAGVDINTLTMEQYLALSRGNQEPGMVKPEIEGNVNFEIKSQFMRELREDTFFKIKNRMPTIILIESSAYMENRQWLDSQGPIPRMTPTQALTAIKTMVDHSQKLHDGTTSRSIGDGLAAIVSKLDNLGRDMKKLKETVHAIQVRCQICEGPHLDKDCPLNEEVKKVEEVKYGEFGLPAPFNGSNGAKFHTGPPGYFTRTDNRLPYGERRPKLKELMSKHQEGAARRSTEMEEIHSQTTNGVPSSSSGQIKVVTTDHEKPSRPISSRQLNNLHGVSFISDSEEEKTPEVLQCQLPPKELNPGSFALPCTIGNFNFYAMDDLGASVNVIPKSVFEYLGLANLKDTNMLIEMADMTKKAPLGIVKNTLVMISKFLFPSDFVIMDATLMILKNMKGIGLSFLDYLLAKYGKCQTENLVWDGRYAEWCYVSPEPGTSSQKSNVPRPRGYTFREWTLTKVGHTDVSDLVKKALLKLWLIDCFQDDLGVMKYPHSRSFDDYKWDFDLEIDKLEDEYKLGIGKKGYMLDNIWEYCKKVHNDNTSWWHDHRFEEDERDEIGIEKYDPSEVQVETFEVKRYSFKGGQSFVCVSKDLNDTLPLRRENGAKFKEMIRKELEEDSHNET
ncbi:zinc knuckle CX2CX4HX4C containing protein [Tanacetum coccineum]